MKISLLQTIKIKYIYGAGIIATSIYQALHFLYHQVPDTFIVSSIQGNPNEIDGILVRSLNSLQCFEKTDMILLAIPEEFQSGVKQELIERGLHDEQIICLNHELENVLMETYIRSLTDMMTATEWLDKYKQSQYHDDINVEVLQAKCHVDKSLQTITVLPEYVYPIQVGATLTDQVICKLQDNRGDNISSKNRNYCELTATYFGWKHVNAAYKGLCHYRRIFDIDDMMMEQLVGSGVDVILPYPSIHFPDIHSQHVRYISDNDWMALIKALQEVKPEYYDDFESVYQGQFFYNFNMLIARREVFDDYCDFLFGVLGRVEELTSPKGWERADRFAGYMGENLTTLYFRRNASKLKIVHAGKNWFI